MSIAGIATDWVETVAEAVDDPESRPAGFAEPHYPVSEKVTMSRDHGIYVYHLPDDQLGQGSSLGNARAWAETKGNGDMLRFFSIEAGTAVFGGMSVTYQLPFSDLSTYGMPLTRHDRSQHTSFTRAMPSATGYIHLHPGYQQREFVIGDGVHVLETFFLPRTGTDDAAIAYEVVSLKNRTPHPIILTVVFSLDPRGETPMDLRADYDKSRSVLVVWNESCPDWVRTFGSGEGPGGYWATTDQEEAYSPIRALPNSVEETGNLTAALQFNLLVYPSQRRKLRVALTFSPHGREDALEAFDRAVAHKSALKETIEHYTSLLDRAVVDMPDDLLTHGVQWAKACLVRPMSQYAVGLATTNDPGRSTHLVARDSSWYVYGCDFVEPRWSCSMLRAFAQRQRADGLIPEYLDGNTGKTEDFGFNINDGTPLFITAVNHHAKTTGHRDCLDDLYDATRRAGELILSQRDERGLVRCTASGIGPRGTCGWRNALQNQQITGVVTEINSECYAALRSLAELAEMRGLRWEADHYHKEADNLRDLINEHLLDREKGLYALNIDLDGRIFTQATCDLVFPLMFGVADDEITRVVTARLAKRDFMTDAGIRVLPSENPHYDPSFESGCMGGVWPGVTWWYAMSTSATNEKIMAESLRRAYSHYIIDPKVYNTVPGQFSEWSDGQTLVNRGMRLSPWESPRFLWAAIEGLAGIKIGMNSVALDPRIPDDWNWLMVRNVVYRDGRLSYFLARQGDGLHVYTSNSFETDLAQHTYSEELPGAAEPITTGISTMTFRAEKEVLICLGSNLSMPAIGPFLAHHALQAGERYRVQSLYSLQDQWEDLCVMKGSDLQRIVVDVEGRGFALYRFMEEE